MSSSRISRFRSSKYLRSRSSMSPTLTSSQSEKSLWRNSYKNQPIPLELRRRLIGKKYKFDDSQDQEEEMVAVEEQEEQEHHHQNKKRLPKFKVISDWGEFSDFRQSRVRSQRKRQYSQQRCRSVESFRLPQVVEQKKQQDDLKKLGLSKLIKFRDNNEFGRTNLRNSSSDYTEVASKVDSSSQMVGLGSAVPEQITENQAEETKSVKLTQSIITNEIEKLIVDELDEIQKKKQDVQAIEIESIIEEEKQEQQAEVDTEKLRKSLSKFESESEYLGKIADDDQNYTLKNSGLEIEEEESFEKAQAEESINLEQ